MIRQRENLVSNEIKLSIKIDDNGSLSIVGKEAKKTSDSLGNLDKTTNKAAKSQGTLDRNLKGTANMTSNGISYGFSKVGSFEYEFCCRILFKPDISGVISPTKAAFSLSYKFIVVNLFCSSIEIF